MGRLSVMTARVTVGTSGTGLAAARGFAAGEHLADTSDRDVGGTAFTVRHCSCSPGRLGRPDRVHLGVSRAPTGQGAPPWRRGSPRSPVPGAPTRGLGEDAIRPEGVRVVQSNDGCRLPVSHPDSATHRVVLGGRARRQRPRSTGNHEQAADRVVVLNR